VPGSLVGLAPALLSVLGGGLGGAASANQSGTSAGRPARPACLRRSRSDSQHLGTCPVGWQAWLLAPMTVVLEDSHSVMSPSLMRSTMVAMTTMAANTANPSRMRTMAQ